MVCESRETREENRAGDRDRERQPMSGNAHWNNNNKEWPVAYITNQVYVYHHRQCHNTVNKQNAV